jgi:AraC-like DNA-binding protein
MERTIKTDLIPLLENLTAALQPYAAYHSVDLKFHSELPSISISHTPEVILSDLAKLLCRVILLTPQDFGVILELTGSGDPEEKHLVLTVRNNSGNLEGLFKPYTTDLHHKITVTHLAEGGNTFVWHIPIQEEEEEQGAPKKSQGANPQLEVPFHQKLLDHLASHFSSVESLEKAAITKGQRECVFIQKVNAILLANLDQEGFDTETLGKALALSRTQLYRRLKSIIGFSPSRYIWFVRLQKAKEMLEKEDLSVGEVAFRTGFKNLSHFTRAFRKEYGATPSQLKQTTL